MSEHTALITGGARGIGRAVAERLGREGCAVAPEGIAAFNEKRAPDFAPFRARASRPL